jgi:hypothetical protein
MYSRRPYLEAQLHVGALKADDQRNLQLVPELLRRPHNSLCQRTRETTSVRHLT